MRRDSERIVEDDGILMKPPHQGYGNHERVDSY